MDLNAIKNINNLPSISQTIKEYNLSAKKNLSQNYILDLNLTNKIINLSDGIKNINPTKLIKYGKIITGNIKRE